MVAVRILGERAGVNFDGLREIERDAVAVRRQNAFDQRKNGVVHHQRAGRRGAGEQPPETFGPLAEEVADAIGRRREIIVERRIYRVDLMGRDQIADDAKAVAVEPDGRAIGGERPGHAADPVAVVPSDKAGSA